MTATSPGDARAPRPVVLFHVGWPKTGTTSLQDALRDWPNLAGRPDDRDGGAAAVALRRALLWGDPSADDIDAHLRRATVDPDLPVIHSDEACIGGSRQWFNGARDPRAVAGLLARTRGDGRVLLTLRSPRPWLRSSYLYAVRSGYPQPYPAFLARVADEVDAGRGPWDWAGVADAYDAHFGRSHVALAWFEDLVRDPAAFWDGIARRLDLDPLRRLGHRAVPRLNPSRLGPPAVELALNRWLLSSPASPPRGLRRLPRARVASSPLARWVPDRSAHHFRGDRARGEDQLVAHLEAAARVLGERYDRARPDA